MKTQTNTIKKFKIQCGYTEIRFYKDGVCQFEKISIPNINDIGMELMVKAWLSGVLK